MSGFNQHDIRRELITVEEKLFQIRESFVLYAGKENVQEVREIDATLKKVQSLQKKIQKWFA